MIEYKIINETNSNTNPYADLTVLPVKNFPNGERIYELPHITEDEGIIFVLKYEGDADLFALFVYATLCTNPKMLYLPYLPYGRADRKVDTKLPTIEAIVKLLNMCDFKYIVIQEPHNPNAILPFLNAQIMTGSVTAHWDKIIAQHSITHLCFPDKGSAERNKEFIEKYYTDLEIIEIEKKRNPITGAIESMQLVENIDLTNAKVLIVDDICSKGGTFIGAGNLLRQQGAQEVYLYVNYCERTIYDGDILKQNSPINMVYTDAFSAVGLFSAEKLTLLQHIVAD